MSLWVALWVLLAVALLGFLGWTVLLLLRQKKTWKAFAAKHKLRYQAKAFMETPEMDGTIDGYKVSFFSGEHITQDVRGSRRLMAIEINLNSVMPIEGGIASGGMVRLVRALEFKAEVRPDHKDWDEHYIAAGDDRGALAAYLTPARIEALCKLMKLKNAWAVLVFKNDVTLLRVDTPNPLASMEYLDGVTKLMLKAAALLELKDGEAKTIEAARGRNEGKDKPVTLKDQDLNEPVGLELEEEPAEETPEPEEPQDD